MSEEFPALDVPSGPRRYAGASADERKAQRRERLIEAGFAVFGRDGYLKTTMRLVCAQARLSERYFYESFESVDELFKAVHRAQASRAWEHMKVALAAAPTSDGTAMIRAALRAFFAYIQEDPRRGQILLDDSVTAGLADPQRLGTRIAQFSDLVRDRLLLRYPEMRQDLVIDYVAAGFSGMVIQVGTVWVSRGYDTPIDVLVEHIVYAWRGLYVWLDESATAKRQAAVSDAKPEAQADTAKGKPDNSAPENPQ